MERNSDFSPYPQFDSMDNGINDDNPNISNKLQILLPITFPTDISDAPCSADVVLTNNSGIEVPIDTIVNPITISDIRSFFAIALEPFTSISAPFINNTNPNNINNI